MYISRRKFVLGLSGVSISFGTTNASSLSAFAATERSASIQSQIESILRSAEQLQLIEAGTSRAGQTYSEIDLAIVVLNGLQKEQRARREIRSLLGRAASLLTALNRSKRDFRGEPEGRRSYAFAAVKQDYRDKFTGCNLQQQHKPEIDKAISFILSPAARQRYVDVQNDPKNTGTVPWYVIAALHFREASLNFLGHLHNGNPLDRLTTDVPPNRPRQRPWPPSPWDPISAWKTSALDALTDLPKIAHWTVEQMLWGFENYNGIGCRDHGIASPYLWSYSQYYRSGGYYSDGKYSATWVSRQAGLGLLIKALSDRSSDVHIEYEPT